MPSISFELLRLPVYGVEHQPETVARVRHDDNATIEPFEVSGGRYAARAEGDSIIVLETVPDGIPVATFTGPSADILSLEPGHYQIVVT